MIKHLLASLHYEDVMISLTKGSPAWLSAHQNPIRAVLLDLRADSLGRHIPAGVALLTQSNWTQGRKWQSAGLSAVEFNW